MTTEQLERLREAPIANGSRVAAAFVIAAVTQAECMRATGFSRAYVSDVARGRFPSISVPNARRFARFFGCAIEDLWPAPDAALPFHQHGDDRQAVMHESRS